jgi:transposase
MGHEVCLSHPKQTKAIAHARLKSDKVDAVMLARLLKADFLPTVWIPGEKERYLRELSPHRLRVRSRTGVINELHAVYAKRNIEVPGMIWHIGWIRFPGGRGTERVRSAYCQREYGTSPK